MDKCYDLFNVNIFKYLVEKGANLHANNDYTLRYSAENNYYDIYEFLKSKC